MYTQYYGIIILSRFKSQTANSLKIVKMNGVPTYGSDQIDNNVGFKIVSSELQ